MKTTETTAPRCQACSFHLKAQPSRTRSQQFSVNSVSNRGSCVRREAATLKTGLSIKVLALGWSFRLHRLAQSAWPAKAALSLWCRADSRNVGIGAPSADVWCVERSCCGALRI